MCALIASTAEFFTYIVKYGVESIECCKFIKRPSGSELRRIGVGSHLEPDSGGTSGGG